MSVIHILTEAVANKIAAGEVVERPASVVKELVENSLDAGAGHIQVSVEAGGKRLIRVVDDGSGMSHDDALLAFERHATSKIRSAEDLFEIATLGFRGEALPSVAAVSRLVLETRHASENSGTRLEMAGGRLRDVKEVAWEVGTRLEVRDLFYNTPARRKFLKSESTELGHIASLVTHYALAHPDKSFRLVSLTQRNLECIAGFEPARARLPGDGRPNSRATGGDCSGGAAHDVARGAGHRGGGWNSDRRPPGAGFRVHLPPGGAQAQSQQHLLLCQSPAGPRPPDPARHHGSVPQHSSFHRVPGGLDLSGAAGDRKWM